MILTNAGRAFVGVLGAIVLGIALYAFYLHTKVNALTIEKDAATARAESLSGINKELRAQAAKHTKNEVAQSTTRASITSKVKAVQLVIQKEAAHESSTRITDAELDRLQRLVNEANAGIKAASTNSK